MNKNIKDSILFLKDKSVEVDYLNVNLNNSSLFIKNLIKENVNENILRYILENFFEKEFVNLSEMDFKNLDKTNFGFIYDGAYVINFLEYYSSNIFKKIQKNHKGKLFDKIIFMNSRQQNSLNQEFKTISKEKNNKNNYKIESEMISLLDYGIRKDIKSFFIDVRKEEIEVNFGYFKKKMDWSNFINLDLDQLVKTLDNLTDGGFYRVDKTKKIKYEKTSENSIYIKIYDYLENKDKIFGTQYGIDFMSIIESNSGTFIFSQDLDYDYYYDVLNYIEEKEDQRVLSFSENLKSNMATKNVTKSEDVDLTGLSHFDFIMVEDLSFLNNNIFKAINSFASIGKKVIIFTKSKDAINSLSNIIYNFPEINKDILSANIGGIYHISKVPLLCPNCNKKSKLLYADGVREKYPDLLTKYSKKEIIKLRNKKGCENCNSGYLGFDTIEQIVRRSVTLSKGINNFNGPQLKDELSSEANYTTIFEKIELLVLKDKTVSIYDIKDKI